MMFLQVFWCLLYTRMLSDLAHRRVPFPFGAQFVSLGPLYYSDCLRKIRPTIIATEPRRLTKDPHVHEQRDKYNP